MLTLSQSTPAIDIEFRNDIDCSVFMATHIFDNDHDLGSDVYAAIQDLI